MKKILAGILLTCLASYVWAFPYNAMTGPQLAAMYGWKDLGTQGLTLTHYDQIYAVGLIQLARNAIDLGNKQYSYLGGGLLVEAGGKQFLVCAGDEGPGGTPPKAADGIYTFFDSTGGNPSALNYDIVGNKLSRFTYSAWPLAMFADHELWQKMTDQAISVTNKAGYTPNVDGNYGCMVINGKVDRWYISPGSSSANWSLSNYGLSDKTAARVYAVGWRTPHQSLITVQTNRRFANNMAQYVNLKDRNNPAIYHYYQDSHTHLDQNGKPIKQVIVAIDSENWGVTGNVIICIQYYPNPDDTLSIKAKAVPNTASANIWFQPSQPAQIDLKVDTNP